MNNLLLIFPAFYAIQVLKWCFYVRKRNGSSVPFQGKVTWLIPFKNEAKNLENFFQSVVHQSYLPFEIILVNDGSTDDSVVMVQNWMAKIPIPVQLLHQEQKGKKLAISKGVEKAEGDVIVCSDADCVFDPEFLLNLVQSFSQEGVVWVSGRVKFFSDGGFWKEVLASENEGLQAITAASIRANQPTMANGAAMAFRKSTFFEVGGYRGLEHLASGDDELLLHRMWGMGELVYAENAVVYTHSVSTWAEFWKQRKRWVSKSGDYENKRMQITMLVAWLSRCSWMICLFGVPSFGIKIFLAASFLMIIPEVFLLQIWGLSFLRAVLHLIIQVPYTFYVILIPFLSRSSQRG